MALFIPYTPTTAITRALFNFDAVGADNYRVSGTVRVSLSDAFTAAEQASADFYPDIYSVAAAEVNWSTAVPQGGTMASSVEQTLAIITQFANISFDWRGDIDSRGADTVVSPADVGAANLSDINISLISRADVDWVGLADGDADGTLGYQGAAGDVFINASFLSDTTFGLASPARTTLLHELLHSLGPLPIPTAISSMVCPPSPPITPPRARLVSTSSAFAPPPRRTCTRNIFPSCPMTTATSSRKPTRR